MRHPSMHRTWVEVDLDRLESNFRYILSRIGPDTALIAVVKSDAYGAGAPVISALLDRHPRLTMFSVASFEEGVQLRRRGIRKPILVMGYCAPELAEQLARHNLTATVMSASYAGSLNEFARQAGCTVEGHMKIDSGMCRLGIPFYGEGYLQSALEEARAILAQERLRITGLFTHFATADAADEAFTNQQFDNFVAMQRALEAEGHAFETVHCCNSAAVAFHPACELQAVRSGSLFYGVQPDGQRPQQIERILQLKSRIGQVKRLPDGATIGYDRTYTVRGGMTIAVIPCGYADGLPYGLSNKGFVLIGGKRAPIVGNVCMDQLMVDITGIEEAREGQEVTFFGADGAERLPLEELVQTAGVFHAQLFTNLTKRVPRVYLREGRVVEVEDVLTTD